MERRKKILALSGKSFLSLASKGEAPFPTILVCINGYDILYDAYFDLVDEVFSPIARDGSRVGIQFVMTSTSGIMSKLESSFPQRLALRFVEYDDYLNVLDNTNGIVPTDTAGRGLVELDGIYEFQVAQIFEEELLEKSLSYVINKLATIFPKAPGIPAMPKVVGYENVKNEIVTLDSVPIGIEMISNCVKYFDFNNLVNLILYSEPEFAQDFVVSLIKVLKKLENSKVVWIDSLETDVEVEGIKRYSSSYGNLASALYKSIIEKKSVDPNSEKIIFVISGYQSIESYLEKAHKDDKNIKTLDDLVVASIGAENYKFIILDSADVKSIDKRKWVDYYDYDRGILIARDPDEQEIFDINSGLGTGDIKYTKDIATVIDQGIPTIIKYIRK